MRLAVDDDRGKRGSRARGGKRHLVRLLHHALVTAALRGREHAQVDSEPRRIRSHGFYAGRQYAAGRQHHGAGVSIRAARLRMVNDNIRRPVGAVDGVILQCLAPGRRGQQQGEAKQYPHRGKKADEQEWNSVCVFFAHGFAAPPLLLFFHQKL